MNNNQSPQNQHNGNRALKRGISLAGKSAERAIKKIGRKAAAKLGKVALQKLGSAVLLKTAPIWGGAIALLLLVVVIFALLLPDFSSEKKLTKEEEAEITQKISEYISIGQEIMTNPTWILAMDMVKYDNQNLLDYDTNDSAYHFFSLYYEKYEPAQTTCIQKGQGDVCIEEVETPEKIIESGSYSGKSSIQGFFSKMGQPLNNIIAALNNIRGMENVRLTVTGLPLESAMADAGLDEEQKEYLQDILESELIYEEYPQFTNGGGFIGIGGGAFCSPNKEINSAAWNQSFANVGVLSTHGQTIINLANQYTIDPVLFAAIAFHESAYGKSNAILTKNNPGGLMGKNGLMVFPTLNDGLESMARTLHNRIIKDGLTTLDRLGSVYAPVGAANDPTGLNNHWVPTVSKIVGNLGGLTMNCESYTDGSTIVFDGDVTEAAKTVASVGTRWIGNSVYKFGGGRSESDISKGWFDCSSFVHWAYKQAGINLGNVTSTSTETLNKMGKKVSASDLRVGDLIFFDSYKRDGHVGIYIGNGRWIGSQGSTGVAIVSMNDNYWNPIFKGHVRRLLPEA